MTTDARNETSRQEVAAFALGVQHAHDGVAHPGYAARTIPAARSAMRHLCGRIAGLPGDACDEVTDLLADAYEQGRISALPAMEPAA